MASAKEFVQSPSMEVLETFKKDVLMQIAQELKLVVACRWSAVYSTEP